MSVGSYSPPSTHEPLYSLSTEQPEINHTWSSRGPTFNQGSEIRPGRIKSYRIRGRIQYDQYEYE